MNEDLRARLDEVRDILCDLHHAYQESPGYILRERDAIADIAERLTRLLRTSKPCTCDRCDCFGQGSCEGGDYDPDEA